MIAAGGPAGKRADLARDWHRAAGGVGHRRRRARTRPHARSRREQPSCRKSRQKRAPVERHHLPIITSEALMTAQASSPGLEIKIGDGLIGDR